MKSFSEHSVILWDFDGVIMDSMPIRDKGFEEVLKKYPKEEVALLMDFHRKNGGLSRYVKFRYFFEEVRKEKIQNEEILKLANDFSKLMLSALLDERLLLLDSVSFIKNNSCKQEMHIVSGSDENELNQICEELGLSKYFKSIKGSPTPKNELVEKILANNKYERDKVALVGDSINDFEAAKYNSISFFGYNNKDLKGAGKGYIENFNQSY